MDASEATKIVMSRIRSLDPENASKIMGYTLIQDQGEKEMIRLAFSPDALLQSHVHQAKARLGLSSNRDSVFAPRIAVPSNGFRLNNPSSPVAPPFRGSSSPRPPLSYASVLDSPNNSGSGSPSLHFYGGTDFGEDFFSGGAQEQLLFHDGPAMDPMMSPGGRRDSLVFPYDDDVGCIPNSPHFHRSDPAFVEEGGNDEGGLVWRPCVYFARGFCKNGSSCNFLHSGDGIEELVRMKSAIQHQRLALMASGGGHYPFGYNKCLNGNLRGDLLPPASSSARQIYLTFPADSTFKEQDVSNYFGMFGPVQDVRIPYQQKRMFGFVTFVYPETVKLILAKGNPHFLCDCRVLVKPYKEKGKVREKKQQQHQSERVEYACLSPTGADSRDNFEVPFDSRIGICPQDELQHAIELQGRRMMNLGLMDMENQNHAPLFMRSSCPSSIPYSSPRQSQFLVNQHITPYDSVNLHNSEAFVVTELDSAQEAVASSVVEGTESSMENNIISGGNQLHQANADGSDLPKSLQNTSSSETWTTHPIATFSNNAPAQTGSSP